MFGFGKKKETQATSEEELLTEPTLPKGYTPKKGSATPSRKAAEKANRRPVVADKTKLSKEERKARKKEERIRSDKEWNDQQRAMRTGDEAHMPYQHRGKVRRFGRDYVDAASPISAWFMPFAILLVPLMFISAKFPQVAFVGTIAFYSLFALMLIHGLWVCIRAKKLAAYNFGASSVPRGFTWQMLGRAFYLRRWRLPVAKVARGEYPEGGTKADWKAMKAAARIERKNSGV